MKSKKLYMKSVFRRFVFCFLILVLGIPVVSSLLVQKTYAASPETLNWVNNTSIEYVYHPSDPSTKKSYTFTSEGENKDTYKEDVMVFKSTPVAFGSCSRSFLILIKSSDYTKADGAASTPIWGGGYAQGGSCTNAQSDNLNDYLKDGKGTVKATAATDKASFASTNTDTPDENANPTVQCENKIGLSDVGNALIGNAGPAIGKGLNWMICTVIRAINGAINVFDNFIQSQLQFSSNKLEDTEGYYQAWSSMRYIAVGLLLIMGLIMIISQMIGMGPFDAYTVKKVLPRMLIAAILITLSWFLCKLFIEIFNILGESVRSLLYAPFGGHQGIQNELNKNLNGGSGGTDAAFAGAAVGGYFLVATTNWLVILTFALPVLIGILVGFFFIVMRKVLIILLVITAPLALAAYILPGTDKIWKHWHENFFRALLMYPLIIAFLSVGRIFAVVTLQDKSGGAINQIIALVVYFGPYFMIPLTFKLAGGFLGTVIGAANDRGRGLLDRSKKIRQTQQAKTWQDTRNFNRFKGNNAFSRGMSRAMGYTSHMDEAGLNAAKWKGRLSKAASDNAIGQREAMLEDKSYTWKGNDTLNRAASLTRNESELRRMLQASGNYNGPDGKANLDRDVARVESMRRKYGTTAFQQATWLQAVAGGTAFEGASDAWQAAAYVSNGDNMILADLVAKGRSAAMSAGRVDQGGAGFGDTMAIAQQFRANPNFSTADASRQLTRHVIDTQGAGVMAHSSMKTQAVRNLAPAMVERVDEALRSGDDRAVAQTLASTAGVLDAMGQSNHNNATEFANVLMDHGVTAYGGHDTVSQVIEAYRGDTNFQQMRREYQSQASANASRPLGPPPAPGSPAVTQPPTTPTP